MTWGIWWILKRAVASLKIWNLMCYFCQKYIMFDPKKGRKVMCHNTEEHVTLTCSLKNDMRNLANFDPTLENLKVYTLMGSIWLKHIMSELKNYRGAVSGNWRMMQYLKKNWLLLYINSIRNLVNFHPSSQ